MYKMRREELKLRWNAVQRAKGRYFAELCTLMRIAHHPESGPYRRYVGGMTKKLEKRLEDDEPESDSPEAFFGRLSGVKVRS